MDHVLGEPMRRQVAAPLMLILSFVLWTRFTFDRGGMESWRALRSESSFAECLAVAHRLATLDSEAYPLGSRDGLLNLRQSVETTDLGAMASVSWQTPEQLAAFQRNKARSPGLGGSSYQGNIAVVYECWHGDVNLNKIQR